MLLIAAYSRIYPCLYGPSCCSCQYCI